MILCVVRIGSSVIGWDWGIGGNCGKEGGPSPSTTHDDIYLVTLFLSFFLRYCLIRRTWYEGYWFRPCLLRMREDRKVTGITQLLWNIALLQQSCCVSDRSRQSKFYAVPER